MVATVGVEFLPGFKNEVEAMSDIDVEPIPFIPWAERYEQMQRLRKVQS